MGLTAIRNVCEVSLDIPAEKQPKLHNRWHPDIPFAGTIMDGETVKIECVCTPEMTIVIILTSIGGRLDWWADW